VTVTSPNIFRSFPMVVVDVEQIDEWKLSADGKVLTQTSRVSLQKGDAAFIPAMALDRKRVYNRG